MTVRTEELIKQFDSPEYGRPEYGVLYSEFTPWHYNTMTAREAMNVLRGRRPEYPGDHKKATQNNRGRYNGNITNLSAHERAIANKFVEASKPGWLGWGHDDVLYEEAARSFAALGELSSGKQNAVAKLALHMLGFEINDRNGNGIASYLTEVEQRVNPSSASDELMFYMQREIVDHSVFETFLSAISSYGSTRHLKYSQLTAIMQNNRMAEAIADLNLALEEQDKLGVLSVLLRNNSDEWRKTLISRTRSMGRIINLAGLHLDEERKKSLSSTNPLGTSLKNGSYALDFEIDFKRHKDNKFLSVIKTLILSPTSRAHAHGEYISYLATEGYGGQIVDFMKQQARQRSGRSYDEYIHQLGQHKGVFQVLAGRYHFKTHVQKQVRLALMGYIDGANAVALEYLISTSKRKETAQWLQSFDKHRLEKIITAHLQLKKILRADRRSQIRKILSEPSKLLVRNYRNHLASRAFGKTDTHVADKLLTATKLSQVERIYLFSKITPDYGALQTELFSLSTKKMAEMRVVYQERFAHTLTSSIEKNFESYQQDLFTKMVKTGNTLLNPPTGDIKKAKQNIDNYIDLIAAIARSEITWLNNIPFIPQTTSMVMEAHLDHMRDMQKELSESLEKGFLSMRTYRDALVGKSLIVSTAISSAAECNDAGTEASRAFINMGVLIGATIVSGGAMAPLAIRILKYTPRTASYGRMKFAQYRMQRYSRLEETAETTAKLNKSIDSYNKANRSLLDTRKKILTFQKKYEDRTAFGRGFQNCLHTSWMSGSINSAATFTTAGFDDATSFETISEGLISGFFTPISFSAGLRHLVGKSLVPLWSRQAKRQMHDTVTDVKKAADSGRAPKSKYPKFITELLRRWHQKNDPNTKNTLAEGVTQSEKAAQSAKKRLKENLVKTETLKTKKVVDGVEQEVEVKKI